MCQPGRPGTAMPHGRRQPGSPGFDGFHSTKSIGDALVGRDIDPGAGLISSSGRFESAP